jgi:hypothetical protein
MVLRDWNLHNREVNEAAPSTLLAVFQRSA